MSATSRILAGLGLVIVAVLLFIVLAPGETDEDQTLTTTEPARTDGEGVNGDRTDTASPEPEVHTEPPPGGGDPVVPTVRVQHDRVMGGPLELEVERGEQVRFNVRSNVDEEIHVHGYDVTSEVGPGRPARIRFRADLEGVYEVELHGSGAPIATLTINP